MSADAERAKALRESWEAAWSVEDRAWDRRRRFCQCVKPAPGPRYLGQHPCRVCGGIIQSGRVKIRRR